MDTNTELNQEEIRALAEKVKSGTATPEEELLLLKTLNNNVIALRAVFKDLEENKIKQEISDSMNK